MFILGLILTIVGAAFILADVLMVAAVASSKGARITQINYGVTFTKFLILGLGIALLLLA